MSNRERQRKFRERNPGYYQRLHARQRAQMRADMEMLARERAIAKTIAPPMPLCLPSPEQVKPSWADQLIREIVQAAAQRAGATASDQRESAVQDRRQTQ